VKRWTVVLPAAVVACLLAVLTWQVIAAGALTAQDMPVHRWVLGHPGARSSPLWAGLGELGDGRVTLPVLGAVCAAFWRRRRTPRPLLVPAVALGLFAAALGIMKAAIGRAAPATGSDAVFVGGGEFPSGHTATATVVCGMIVYLAFCVAGRESTRASRWACLAPGALAGACAGTAMVLLDYHWLTDVVGGWLLGILALDCMLVAQLLGRDRRQLTERQGQRAARPRETTTRDS
jgi:membrane-associated phospholipid phosphatase